MSDVPVPFLLARRVGDVFDRCGVPWVVGGSLASQLQVVDLVDLALAGRAAPR